MDDTRLTRRDALKVGAFGAAALALPLTVTLSGARASQIAANRIPRPYTVPFDTPAELAPSGTKDGFPLYRIEQRQFTAEILPGVATDMFGYNSQFPGPTIRVQQNQTIVVRMGNDLPARHPVFGYETTTSTHLHGHPSRPQFDGYANDLTAPRQFKDYVYENERGCADDLVPRPRRPPHRRERLLGAGRAVPRARPDRQTAAQREIRRPADHQRRRVHLPRPAPVRRPRRLRPDGRRHPGQRPALAGDAGRATEVPLPAAQRLDRAGLPPAAVRRVGR